MMIFAARAVRLATIAGAVACVVGCSNTFESASLGFAVPSSAAALTAGKTTVGTHAVRVLVRGFDLRQPVFLQRAGDAIEVTYGVKQRGGVTVRLDPRTLRPVDEAEPYVYPACSARDLSRNLARDVARVSLDSGHEVTVFTSEDHHRAYARVGEEKAVALTPDGMQIVGPARATTHGRDVVAVFVAATDDGFSLVATSFEVGSLQR